MDWEEQLNTQLVGATSLTEAEVYAAARRAAEGITVDQMRLVPLDLGNDEDGIVFQFKSRFPRLWGDQPLGAFCVVVEGDARPSSSGPVRALRVELIPQSVNFEKALMSKTILGFGLYVRFLEALNLALRTLDAQADLRTTSQG